MSTRDEAIRHFIAAGWDLVPIRPGEKRPTEEGWPDRHYTVEDLSAGKFGVKLGVASHDVADVDLDCEQALVLADLCLPPTVTYGRRSTPRSHRLYRAPGAFTRLFGYDGTLVELRAQSSTGRSGAQSVPPPNIHDGGEPYEWDEDDGRDAIVLPDAAAEIDAADLLERVIRLAIGCVVMIEVGEAEARRVIGSGGTWPRLSANAAARICGWLDVADPQPQSQPVQLGGDVVERARRYLAHTPVAVTGEFGGTRTFIVAQHMVHGFRLDDATAYELLKEWNKGCKPPWTERGLKRKIKQAREHGKTVAIGVHLGAAS